MEYDEILDKLIDKVLVLNLVTVVWDGDQSWAEANGKIVWVHHVLITVFRKVI